MNCQSRSICARRTPSRRNAVRIGPAVMGWLRRLFGETPSLSEAGRADAAAIAVLHAASFHRGWSDGEFESLLAERNVIAHRAMLRR